MKLETVLNVCMYSGMCQWDPRVTLTQEESDQLLNMVKGADAPAVLDRFGTGVLGTDSFVVSFVTFDPDNFDLFATLDTSTFPDIITVYSLPGIIGIWRREDPTYSEMKWYKDDLGVHEFLSTLAAPAIRKHQEEMFIAASAPWNPPPWEPNF